MHAHYRVAFQHHHTVPAHTWQLDLSRLAHHAANHHASQLGLARQALIPENERQLGSTAIENKDNKSLEDSNCTPLSEDHACLPATTMTTALKRSPTHQQQAKETTTIKDREITQTLILENERKLGSKAIDNHDNKPSEDSNCTQLSEDDDEVTKELKETVIKIFIAAGVLETGFTKDSMAKHMLGMVQAGKLSVSEEEVIAFCHAQCDEMFQTLDGNIDGTVTTTEAFDFVLKQLLAGAGYGSLANVPTEMKMQALK